MTKFVVFVTTITTGANATHGGASRAHQTAAACQQGIHWSSIPACRTAATVGLSKEERNMADGQCAHLMRIMGQRCSTIAAMHPHRGVLDDEQEQIKCELQGYAESELQTKGFMQAEVARKTESHAQAAREARQALMKKEVALGVAAVKKQRRLSPSASPRARSSSPERSEWDLTSCVKSAIARVTQNFQANCEVHESDDGNISRNNSSASIPSSEEHQNGEKKAGQGDSGDCESQHDESVSSEAGHTENQLMMERFDICA